MFIAIIFVRFTKIEKNSLRIWLPRPEGFYGAAMYEIWGRGERGGSGIWEGGREGGGKSLDRFRDDDDGSKLRSVVRVDFSIDTSMLFSFANDNDLAFRF